MRRTDPDPRAFFNWVSNHRTRNTACSCLEQKGVFRDFLLLQQTLESFHQLRGFPAVRTQHSPLLLVSPCTGIPALKRACLLKISTVSIKSAPLSHFESPKQPVGLLQLDHFPFWPTWLLKLVDEVRGVPWCPCSGSLNIPSSSYRFAPFSKHCSGKYCSIVDTISCHIINGICNLFHKACTNILDCSIKPRTSTPNLMSLAVWFLPQFSLLPIWWVLCQVVWTLGARLVTSVKW